MPNELFITHHTNDTSIMNPFTLNSFCFPFQISMPYIEPADKHGITLIPAYIPIHLNVEADCLSQGQLFPKWHLFSFIAQAAFHLWGQLEVDMLASSHTSQCQCYYTLESPLPLGAMKLAVLSHLWRYQMSYVSPALAIFPLVPYPSSW